MARPENGYWRDGVRIVSVTEAIHNSGVRRMMGSQADIERRQRIGSAVHKLTAIMDFNQTTWDKAPAEWLDEYAAVSPEVCGFVKAWERFKAEMEFVPRLIEHSFITATGIAKFATTIDREGLLGGRPALVEIKTPKAIEPWWGVQLAGQELAVTCAQGPPIERPYRYQRIVAQISASGKFRPIPYDDPADRDVFMWSLGLATWRRAAYGD